LNAEEVVALFGLPAADVRMEALFKTLDTTSRPVLPSWEAFSFHDWIMARQCGIELGFADEAWQSGAPAYRWGDGPLVLTQAYFYSGIDDIAPHMGSLPFGITFADTRDQVREKLKSAEVHRRSYVTDTWDVQGYRLNVVYHEDGQSVDRVACLMVPGDIARDTEVTAPTLATIVQAFGTSLRGEAFGTLWPQGWDDESVAMADEDGELDLTDSYGVTACYTGAKARRKLRSVAFHSNRDAESAGWQGELPADLAFDDSPDTLMQKMVEPPAYQADDGAEGIAVWHRPDHSVTVLYSHVHNRLLRVRVTVPGAWKLATDGEGFEEE